MHLTVHLSNVQVEVFFSRGTQNVFMKYLYHFGSDYSKMRKWDYLSCQTSVDILGSCISKAIYKLAHLESTDRYIKCMYKLLSTK